MNYYLDTEFLEGKQDKQFLGIKYGETKPTIDLISIGIVAEDGRQYYAISKDFNLKEAWNRNDLDPNHKRNYKQKDNYWIRENVLKPIFREWLYKGHSKIKLPLPELNDNQFTYKNFKKFLKHFGKTNKQIAEEIIEFTKPQPTGKVLLSNPPIIEYDNTPIELYGYYSAYDHVALCWLFGKMIDLPKGFPMYSKDLKQIYDQTKYEVSEDIEMWGKELKKHPNYPKQTNEHNALADAEWNQKLHKFLNNI